MENNHRKIHPIVRHVHRHIKIAHRGIKTSWKKFSTSIHKNLHPILVFSTWGLLGVVVLSIIIAIPTSMAITSGNFSISKKTNNVTIKGSSGAKRAIAYVKKKIPLNSVSMPLDNNSKWANGHSNIVLENNTEFLTWTTQNQAPAWLTNDISGGNELINDDIQAFFQYYQFTNNYTNYQMWLNAIYGLGWRILNHHATYGKINWNNNNISTSEKVFIETIPYITTNTYRQNTYTEIKLNYNRGVRMSKYGGQLRTYDEPVSHNVVEVLKAGINGYRQDRWSSTDLNVRLGFESKHGFPSENKYLYVRSGILLIGYSDFDDSDFDYDYANYQVDIKISSDFFMLDYFQAIRTLRINNSNSRINTYL